MTLYSFFWISVTRTEAMSTEQSSRKPGDPSLRGHQRRRALPVLGGAGDFPPHGASEREKKFMVLVADSGTSKWWPES
jgi:hypothetical protein